MLIELTLLAESVSFDSPARQCQITGMCNHYRNDPQAMATLQTWREYIAWDLPELSLDVWPKRDALVARIDGEKRLEAMKWGFPWTTKGKRPGTTRQMNTTNIRNLASPLWRSIINKADNRCLVPFTRFAEPKPGAGREEVWFTVNDAPVSAFAGIWRPSESGNVFAFLTCEPNPLVKPIHPKAMPVILHPEQYDEWLAGENASDFQTAFPSQLMNIAQ